MVAHRRQRLSVDAAMPRAAAGKEQRQWHAGLRGARVTYASA